MLFEWGYTQEGGDERLRKVFSWLTKNRLAPKFGTVSIHHYQMLQFAAINEIKERAAREGLTEPFEVRSRQGDIEGRSVGSKRWTLLGSIYELSRAADRRSYR